MPGGLPYEPKIRPGKENQAYEEKYVPEIPESIPCGVDDCPVCDADRGGERA